MIGTSFAFSIDRGDIPAVQNSAEHDPRLMLKGTLFDQLLSDAVGQRGMHMHIAAQIISSGCTDAAISRNGERAIAESLADSDDIQLIWLPHKTKILTDYRGASAQSTILLVAAGVAFATLVKPFVEAIAKEAGKDFWGMLKKVLGKTASQQAEEIYRVSGDAYVLVEQGEDWVALFLPMPTVSKDDDVPPEESTHKILDEYFTLLDGNWDEIQSRLKRFCIGNTRSYTRTSGVGGIRAKKENVVHLIHCVDTEEPILIVQVPAKRFFNTPGDY